VKELIDLDIGILEILTKSYAQNGAFSQYHLIRAATLVKATQNILKCLVKY
jgi:hypothetical protein